MMYWNGDWGWAAWLTMTVAMMAFWGFVIWGVVAVARGGTPSAQAPPESDPERILAERFARGDIDADEYQSTLTALRAGRSRAR